MRTSRWPSLTLLPTAVFLVMCLPGTALAVLIDAGQTTIDTGTGFEWLDVTETQNVSYNDILNSPFIVQEGYRHATGTELAQFWTNGGLTGFSLTGGPRPMTPDPLSFMQLWGITDDSPPGTGTAQIQALTADVANATQHWVSFLRRNLSSSDVGAVQYFRNDDTSSLPIAGHALVRAAPSSAPSPSSLVLCALPVAGLVARRRSRR